MTTARAAMRAGIESGWTWFGVLIFCRVSDARTRASTPASANVCNEAPGCLAFSSYLPRSTGLCVVTGREDPSGRRTLRRVSVYRIATPTKPRVGQDTVSAVAVHHAYRAS